MTNRRDAFISEKIYHVFNKTIDHKRIFDSSAIANKFLEIQRYYRSTAAIVKFSHFEKLSPIFRKQYEEKILDKSTFRINILAYCVMPTHFHLLLKQNDKGGISFYLSQIQNSFIRYFNIKHDRLGPLFVQTFKSVLIKTEEQLKHVCRYIDLNPYSNGLITDINEIENYQWSSFTEYLRPIPTALSEPEYILSLFGGDRERYRKFVLSNSEYQKTLEYCKHMESWDNNYSTLKVE